MAQTKIKKIDRAQSSTKTADVKPKRELVDDIDDMLDEIDSVLEEACVATSYLQKGGQ